MSGRPRSVRKCADCRLTTPLLLARPSPTASYFDALAELRRALDGAVLSWNDLQTTVHRVNAQVQEEIDREWSPGQTETAPRALPVLYRRSRPSAHLDLSFPEVLAVSLINEALDQGSPEKTLSALLLPSAGLDDISLPVAPRYHFLLVAAKRQKAQVRSEWAGLVTRAGRATPVGGAVPRVHPRRARADDTVPSGGGGQEGPWGKGPSGQALH